jgi:hypothetical protein
MSTIEAGGRLSKKEKLWVKNKKRKEGSRELFMRNNRGTISFLQPNGYLAALRALLQTIG